MVIPNLQWYQDNGFKETESEIDRKRRETETKRKREKQRKYTDIGRSVKREKENKRKREKERERKREKERERERDDERERDGHFVGNFDFDHHHPGFVMPSIQV